jgi:CBS domain-containing protein
MLILWVQRSFYLDQLAGEVMYVSNLLAVRGERDVFCVDPTSTVYRAIEQMALKSVGCLLVIDNNELVGLISERDYTRKVILKGRQSKRTLVDEIMSKNVIYVGMNHSIEQCMALMHQHSIGHLPVVVAGRAVGMLSLKDVLREIMREKTEEVVLLEQYIHGY